MVANEAYLNTARQRISVRRHARLVDYYLHEGCNARAFVHFKVLRRRRHLNCCRATRACFTTAPDAPAVIEPGSADERAARASGVLVFETAHAATLHAALNELDFYTWGDEDCCLPRGATRPRWRAVSTDLSAGDFLVFQEVQSPDLGRRRRRGPHASPRGAPDARALRPRIRPAACSMSRR